MLPPAPSHLPPSYADAEQEGLRLLRQAGVETPNLDARFLLEEASGLNRARLLAHAGDAIPAPVYETYFCFLQRRAQREPVGRILGWREFWGLRFALSPATLEPRPDSETLIEAALSLYPDRTRPYRFCDIGTGTGCLLAALLHEYPHASGVATDISPEALQTAHKNLSDLGLASRATLHHIRWVEGVSGPFDLMVSNPPYIATNALLAPEVLHHDPALALFAGSDGLSAYRALLPSLAALVSDEGFIILEVGEGQLDAVRSLADTHALSPHTTRADLGGIPRALVLIKKPSFT